MRINFHTQNFKGYDAIPLKAIHYEKSPFTDTFDNEMRSIAQKEGFEIRTAKGSCKWLQDNVTFIEQDKTPFMLTRDSSVVDNFVINSKKYNIPQAYSLNYVIGGNSFIGKTSDGERWMLVGEDEIDHTGKAAIGKTYDIKIKNIHSIPQQNYHLDMFLRPLGYPFILVDSPVLVKKKLSQMELSENRSDLITLQRDFYDYEASRQRDFASHNKVMKALKKAGFIPIEIAGVYGRNINFMNAIVNKRPSGAISYITNSSVCESPFISKIEEEFRADLMQKVPFCNRVYFVSGPIEENGENYLMYQLGTFGGGLHCMTVEEPNFDILG